MFEVWQVIVFIVIVIIASFAIHAAPKIMGAIRGGAEVGIEIIETDYGTESANKIVRQIGKSGADVLMAYLDPGQDNWELAEEARCGAPTAVDAARAAARGRGMEVQGPDDDKVYAPALIKKHGEEAVGRFVYFRELDRSVACHDASTDKELGDMQWDLWGIIDREAARPEMHRRLGAEFADLGLTYRREFGEAALEWARGKYTADYTLELGRPNYGSTKLLPGGPPPQRVAYDLYKMRLATIIDRILDARAAGRGVLCVLADPYAADLRRRFRVKK